MDRKARVVKFYKKLTNSTVNNAAGHSQTVMASSIPFPTSLASSTLHCNKRR